MKKLSMADQAILLAVKKGYKVVNGKLLNKFGDVVRGSTHENGYAFSGVRVGKRSDNKTIKYSIHRLAAYQKFGGKVFNKKWQVRHLDGNSMNNKSKNISLGTASENRMDIPPLQRQICARYASSKRKNAIGAKKRKMILKDRKKGMSYGKLKEKYGMSKGTLSYYFNPETGIYK